ncbi:finger CCCH domain-containing 3 [Octopus vulgaris]|uniref:Finger CCCH domain-containing 3 n=1 Tax=Octopus vulgaris TaxID=6645 RepID=A0AA36BKA5_OCTVU|nr:finger CCCH domain-containing 3 [Octopus vulgaris]
MAEQPGLSLEFQDVKILKQEISKLSGLIQKEKQRRALSTCQGNTLSFSRFSNRFTKSSPTPTLPTKTFRSGTYSRMCYLNSKLTQAKPNQTYQNSASTSKTVVSNNYSNTLQSHSLSSKFSYPFKSKNSYSMSTKIPCSSSPSASSSQSNNEVSSTSLPSLSSPNKSLSLFEAKSKMVKNAQEDLIKTEAKLQCLKTTYAKLCSSAPFRTAASQNTNVQEIIHPKDTATKSITSPVKEKPSEPSPKPVAIKQPTCFKNTTKAHAIKLSPKTSHIKSDVSLKSWIRIPSAKKAPLLPSSLTVFPQHFSSQHLSTVPQKPVPQSSKSLKSPLVQCHRYKIVRKPGVKKPTTTPLPKSTKILKQNNLTTPFKLIKNQSASSPSSSSVSLPLRKTGYSYFSSKSLLRARALNRNANSVIAKDYKKRLAALLIDFGKVAYRPKKLASNNLSKQKLVNVSVCRTPSKKTLGKTNIPPKFKMKIDRRRRLSRKYSPCLQLKSSPFSLIKTPLKLSGYRRSSAAAAVKRAHFSKFNSLKTITVRGVKFHVEAGGKTLRRMNTKTGSGSVSRLMGLRKLNIAGVVYTQTSGGMLKRVDNPTVVMANRVVTRSIATAAARLRKGYSKPPAQKPCLFYNRFGKCNKGNKCPYVHDPKKIAVCYRMIRGGCKVENCPFYHQLSKEKMPSCSYFLKGQCNRDNCIYPHVKVNKNAIICEDFLNGYCSLGEKCTRKHSLVCQKFRENQVCSHHACKFNSRKKISKDGPGKSKTVVVKRKRTNSKSSTAAKCRVTKKSFPEELASLSFISLVNSSDESLLDTSTTSNTNEMKSPKETLRIKPRL